MKQKCLVHIQVLGINSLFDFLIPYDMSVKDVYVLVINALKEEYMGSHTSSGILNGFVHKETGKRIDINCSLKQIGIKSGETLIVI